MSDSELIVTVGSQNALCSVLEMILEPGDAVVVPMPVYSSVLSLVRKQFNTASSNYENYEN